MNIKHPLMYSEDGFPVQRVLRDLANQENCDGVPYDQMLIAANYIDELEAALQSEFVIVPDDINSAQDFRKWIMEMNLDERA